MTLRSIGGGKGTEDPSVGNAQPLSFDRFLESVISQLAESMSSDSREAHLPLVVNAIRTAYVASARRSPALFALPIAMLTAADVVSRRWISTSVEGLDLAVRARRFYRVTPRGETTEAIFPVWQFVGAQPDHVGRVLSYLSEQSPGEVHAFWVSECDELNELTPAEMLTGIPFETREVIEKSQRRYLDQPHDERLARVIEMAEHYGLHE